MAKPPIADPYSEDCPSRRIFNLIGNKWTLLLLPVLAEGPKRNGELMRRIEGISQKMLTQTLKGLEEHGLVVRRDYQEVPPRVDYRLTPLGRSLSDLADQVDGWVVDNYRKVEKARLALQQSKTGR